jgi:hypothetical protein
MSLLEEKYKKIDPEGEVNMAFDDREVRNTLSARNINSTININDGISTQNTKKNGIGILDA